METPLQGHNLGVLHLDYFDLLASLAFTVICRSLYSVRFRWPPTLVGSLAWIPHLFDLLILYKSSSALPFLTGRLVGASVYFLHDCKCWQRLCFSSSRRRRRAFHFELSLKRVLMMLWLYAVGVLAAGSS